MPAGRVHPLLKDGCLVVVGIAAWSLAAETPVDAGVLCTISMATEILAAVALAAEVLAAIAMVSRAPAAGVLAAIGLPVVAEAIVGQHVVVETAAVFFLKMFD